ncbi:MAG: hypothetical protein QW292_04010 [Candidatus Parvarchaeota archaeon]
MIIDRKDLRPLLKDLVSNGTKYGGRPTYGGRIDIRKEGKAQWRIGMYT